MSIEAIILIGIALVGTSAVTWIISRWAQHHTYTRAFNDGYMAAMLTQERIMGKP